MVNECTEIIDRWNVCDEFNCTACGACVNICPKQCIKIEKNQFYEGIAKINADVCIQCGRCKQVCPNYKNDLLKKPLNVYAGWRKNIKKIDKCSSGGIATLLSEYMIKKRGVVYGVLGKEGKFFYSRANAFKHIEMFKGSKYVYVSGAEVYKEVEKDLLEQKDILIIGTPCFIAGLKSYFKLKKFNLDKLILIDFLCHGTVPQEFLDAELAKLKRKYIFEEITFRSNKKEENYYLTLREKGKIVYKQKAEINEYFYCFLNSISTKESCLNCKYHTAERCGDLTIGDFIGLGEKIPFDQNSPVLSISFISANNKKGKHVLEENAIELCIFERTLEEAVKGGPSLKECKRDNPDRHKFREKIAVMPFSKAVSKSVGLKIKKNKMKYYLKKIIKGEA